MKDILRALLVEPSAAKYNEYSTQFKNIFASRDPVFHEIFDMLEGFYRKYNTFPTVDFIKDRFEQHNKAQYLEYLLSALADDSWPNTSDATFFSKLEDLEQRATVFDLSQLTTKIMSKASKLDKDAKGKHDEAEGLEAAVDELLAGAHKIRTQLSRGSASIASMVYGSTSLGSGHSLQEIYQRNIEKQASDSAPYYGLGFDKMAPAKFRDGNLIIFGGFTSHGKSVLLRHAAYRQVLAGRNVAFFSFEMSHDDIRMLFALLHANNKEIFPGTPYLSTEAFEDGKLTEEELSFLMDVADYDLRNNPDYGILYIDQPSKSPYRLSDLEATLTELETQFPVHAVAVDYLTLMHPVETERGIPDMTAYNNMIKRFKNLLLTHRNAHGKITPMLGFTAAQISRPGLEKCLKEEKIYDISAFHMYSELEKSADHLFTVLMTADMKATNNLRLQHLKQRGGTVVYEPVDLIIDLARGFTLAESVTANPTQTAELLKTLVI